MAGEKSTDPSTHLNAPGLQLLLDGSQVKGDGCTGVVDPEDGEDLAIVELCKHIGVSVGRPEHLRRSSELRASHLGGGCLPVMRDMVAVPNP